MSNHDRTTRATRKEALENGKTRQKYRNTRSEAAKARQELLDEQQKGILATGPRQTVGQYMEYWLDIHRPSLKVSTYALYRRHLRNHILPGLGHTQTRAILPILARSRWLEKNHDVSHKQYEE